MPLNPLLSTEHMPNPPSFSFLLFSGLKIVYCYIAKAVPKLEASCLSLPCHRACGCAPFVFSSCWFFFFPFVLVEMDSVVN